MILREIEEKRSILFCRFEIFLIKNGANFFEIPFYLSSRVYIHPTPTGERWSVSKGIGPQIYFVISWGISAGVKNVGMRVTHLYA